MRTVLVIFGIFLVLSPAFGQQVRGPDPDPPAPWSPWVRIDSPASGWTRERVVTVTGRVGIVTVENEKTDLRPPERIILVVNGVAQSVAAEGGAFSCEQVLGPGENVIVAIATNSCGTGQDAVVVHGLVPGKDLRITLTWDTAETDIDLRLFGPNGERCDYENKTTNFGAALDTDMTDGYGPETITVGRAPPGTYRVEAHYYGGSGATICRAVLLRDEGTPRERKEIRTVLLRKADDVREVMTFTMGRR